MLETYLALKVVVTGEQQTTRHGRGHGSDTTKNRFGLEKAVSMFARSARDQWAQLTP